MTNPYCEMIDLGAQTAWLGPLTWREGWPVAFPFNKRKAEEQAAGGKREADLPLPGRKPANETPGMWRGEESGTLGPVKLSPEVSHESGEHTRHTVTLLMTWSSSPPPLVAKQSQ